MTKVRVDYQAYIHSKDWQQKSRKFRSIMFDRCAVFPFLKSNQTHHMTYANLSRELLLRDCIPLSNFVHHGIVHPVSRLFHRRHDIHAVRFFVNWLLLRPSLLFWLLVLGLANLWAKLIGKKMVAAIAFVFTGVFGYALLQPTFLPSEYKYVYAIAAYVCLVCHSVFE